MDQPQASMSDDGVYTLVNLDPTPVMGPAAVDLTPPPIPTSTPNPVATPPLAATPPPAADAPAAPVAPPAKAGKFGSLLGRLR
ncbi:MAG: hypothetical protein ABI353_13215, partial [Isosphaeraceae bacterium]